MKMLFFSPAGKAAAQLLPETIERFRSESTDFQIVLYEEVDFAIPPGVCILRDSGSKWQLARRYLEPDFCKQYDYIYVWDDDVAVADFQPLKFISIMEANGLLMAQPSVVSAYGLSHEITRRRIIDEGQQMIGVVGRITNFVEIMVPVFSREGWRLFYRGLCHSNLSGWGYDYLPLAPRGIVDCMHVVHTRPVSSITATACAEWGKTLSRLGISKYEHRELGPLLWKEEIVPIRLRQGL